jgi:hypothetical protein
MNRFQELLKPDLRSTPGADQQRAAAELPNAVKRSHLHWWTKMAVPSKGKAVLLVVAPWSHYDLALLDVLDETLANPRSRARRLRVPVYVANLQDYQTFEQLTNDIPTITQPPPQTPIATLWEDGLITMTAWGKGGRDLTADALGLSSEDLDKQVLDRVPKVKIPSK